MKSKLRVHTAVKTRVTKQVEVNGEQMPADVWGLEVEMVDENNSTYTKRFVGAEAKDAEELFKPDAVISVTFEAYK